MQTTSQACFSACVSTEDLVCCLARRRLQCLWQTEAAGLLCVYLTLDGRLDCIHCVSDGTSTAVAAACTLPVLWTARPHMGHRVQGCGRMA